MDVDITGKMTFRGGVHPPQNKNLTEDKPILPGPAVKQVAVMLSQHIGAPCKPMVQKNDVVAEGQRIGESDAYVSAAVHSPVNGKVKEIALRSHPIQGRSLAIVIDVDAETNSPKKPAPISTENIDLHKYTSEQICDAVSKAGLVGMGGAGFPTRVKIEPDPRLPKKTLIINGCECEPYITCDYRLMIERADEVITGIELAKKASGCIEVFIGIEDNKPKAIEVMTEMLKKTPARQNIKIVPLKTKYPQGGERQLIKAVLGKNVPTGAIPPMVGVVVLNVATAVAITEAVISHKPLTHRVVTVTGQSIANPGNFYVPIGTSVGDMIEFCGGITEKSAKVLMGGPMMGIAIADLETPITKTSGAITLLTKEQIGRAKYNSHKTACIHCGRCLDVCPEHLNPTVLAHAVRKNLFDVAQQYYISACVECGCCSYVCPAKIEITGHIKTGKIHMAREKKRMPK